MLNRTPLMGASLVAAAVAALGCSGDDGQTAQPRTDRAIAIVGDSRILIRSYERELRLAAAQICAQDPRSSRSSDSSGGVGGECPEAPEELKRSVLDRLIEDRWIELEAHRRKVAVPQNDHTLRLATPKRLARDAVDAARGPISDDDVTRYYREHRRLLVQPERRMARSILTDSARRARAAKGRLLEGASWNAVAREFGIPRISPRPVILEGPRQGFLFGLRAPIFSAAPDEIVGPAREGAHFYVIQVLKVMPAYQLPVEAAGDVIEPVLRDRQRANAARFYWRDVRISARRITTCLTALKVPSCRNGSRASFNEASPIFPRSDARPEVPPPPHPYRRNGADRAGGSPVR